MGGMCVGRSHQQRLVIHWTYDKSELDSKASPRHSSGGEAATCPPSSGPRCVCRDAHPDTEGLFPQMPRVSSSGRCGDPGATVTTCHKPGESQQQRFFSHSSGHWKYKLKVWLVPAGTSGNLPWPLLASLVSRNPWHPWTWGCITPTSASIVTWLLLCVCVQISLFL